GLRRPAEVAQDLAFKELARPPGALNGELKHQVVVPLLARIEAFGRRNRELQMHSDIDDYADTAQRLRAEHPEVIVRVLQIAQFAHQALRVQRPAFAVTGNEGQRSLEARQLLGEQAYTRDLNVVARHALVVGDAHLAHFGKRVPPSTGHQVRPGREKSW